MLLILKRILLISIFSFVYTLSFASDYEKIIKQIHKSNFDKAEKILNEEFTEKPTFSTYYAAAYLYLEPRFKSNSPQKAYDYILQAESKYSDGKNKNEVTQAEILALKTTIEKQLLNRLNDENNAKISKLISTHKKSTPKIVSTNIEDGLIRAIKAENIDSLNHYILLDPMHELIQDAVRVRNEVAFEQAVKLNSLTGYQNFILNYPTSDQLEDAKELRNNLAYISHLQKDQELQEIKLKEQEILFAKEKAEKEALVAQKKIFGIIIGGLLLLVGLVVIGNSIIKNDKMRIQEQNRVIEAKNVEILQSINYAGRIQNSLLPSERRLNRNFTNHFVIYEPKNIVSGDFYWTTRKKGHIYFAVGDCTGHGVPGAMVSMFGINALNAIVNDHSTIRAKRVLEKLRIRIIRGFSHNESEMKDGMDISLGRYNIATRELEYSGAFNPMYILRNGEFIELKADRQPIGTHKKMTLFSSTFIKIEENDRLYLLTDGFTDQFGGSENRKITKTGFKNLVLESKDLPLAEQSQVLTKYFSNWKGQQHQLDDVCVVAIEF